MSNAFYYYQKEADDAIFTELATNNVCLVKMFCGTGKSLLMRKCKSVANKKLVVYVFPTLALIRQFCDDYLHDYSSKHILKISSDGDNGSTTNTEYISKFLSTKPLKKIICVTYQSFTTLLDSLNGIKINVCLYDEAHHAVGELYQTFIFNNDVCEKQIFFTATPKNDNGIIMYDSNNISSGMCGKLVYDYSYLQGMYDGYVNPFEISVDMYTKNTNKSVYESIARSILSSGNNRVLTFHAYVNTDSDTSVNNFVNNAEFISAFKKVRKAEFPTNKMYKKINMIGLSSNDKIESRTKTLEKFDETPNDEVIVIASCATIGEGIDTKNANMCVFVDPKTSPVQIIQNIGRIVRKKFGINKPKSTILIPCWVNKEKYVECNGEREKCNEVIMTEMRNGVNGDFNGILQVVSALKQEDEELYNICLNYPNAPLEQEVYANFERQGYKIDDDFDGDGDLIETIEYMLDVEIEDDYDDDTEDEMLERIADDNDVCIEIHTNEEMIVKYNVDNKSGDIIRIYKTINEDGDGDGDVIYKPFIKKAGKAKRTKDKVTGIRRENRIGLNIRATDDVKVLWSIVGNIDLTKDICSYVIDCEVIQEDPMERAVAIVERGKIRRANGLNLLPRWVKKSNQITPEIIQENKDANKLQHWKQSLKGKGGSKCSVEIRDYLDVNLIGWREERDEKAMEDAKHIVKQCLKRVENGFNLMPKNREKNNKNTPELIQEAKDAQKLQKWKQSLKGNGHSKCPDEVRDYLDINLPSWREEYDALEEAKIVVKHCFNRVKNGLNLMPRDVKKKNRTTPELIQEAKDAHKLQKWKQSLKGNGHGKCPDKVRDYLDINLPSWREELNFDEKAMEDAKNIFERRFERGKLLPRKIKKEKQTTPKLIQENKDFTKLTNWKTALKGKGNGNKCSDEVRDYLDTNLPGWKEEYDALNEATIVVKQCLKRVKNGCNLLPRQIEKENRTTLELIQEAKDESKLQKWQYALKGKGKGKCPHEVRDYLDTNLPGWREERDEKAIEDAKKIVKQCLKREENGFNLLPKDIKKKNQTTPELIQESKDAQKLQNWKQALKGNGKKCSNEVRDYLDDNLPGWREEYDFDKKAIEEASNIFERRLERCKLLPRNVKKENQTTTKLIQEAKDANKLQGWRKALKGRKNVRCSDEVRDYLDANLPGWRAELDEKSIEEATNIVKRIQIGNNLLPKCVKKEKQITPELMQENKDYNKLNDWKKALKGTGKGKCPDEVRDYLDANLPGWRENDNSTIAEDKEETVEEQNPQITKEETVKEEEYFLIPKKKKKSMLLSTSSTKVNKEGQKKQKTKTELTILHQKYKTMNSVNLNKVFKETPELWQTYHAIAEENEKSFPEDEIPRNRIIQELDKIRTKRTKKVIDMGCGKGNISQHFTNDPRFEFTNYDHISLNETIQSCDISNLPLEDESIEICILSLAMWGSNCKEYIKEAYRVLETNGQLYIIEPTKRWSEKDENGHIIPEQEGKKLYSLLEENNFHIREQFIAKFSLFVCVK